MKVSRKKWKQKDICKSCSCLLSLHKKPQCSKKYWSTDIKKNHSISIKNSNKFKNGISNRQDIIGYKNPMFGKKHTEETKNKMSLSRIGKVGEKSTAWKGGKLTITRLVKEYQNKNGWYKKVYERDGFKCSQCESKTKIEAHHKIPIKTIVDMYKNEFDNKIDLYNFLTGLDIIIDINIENGITLCRECHKKEHINFGSHSPITNSLNL